MNRLLFIQHSERKTVNLNNVKHLTLINIDPFFFLCIKPSYHFTYILLKHFKMLPDL